MINIKKPKKLSDALWTISLRKPKSKRFSQLSLGGFRPKGKNSFERFINILFDFATFVFKYVKYKIRKAFKLGGLSVALSLKISRLLKGFLVKKLIWSRGKLGRQIATSVVLSVAFLVFMFGEVLNSSRFVVSQEINPDYLSTVTDIIPQRNIAITTVPESRKQAKSFIYVVEGGDTLSSIGNKFKISVDAIKYVNGLTDFSVLSVGKELTIPPVSGLIHTVSSGDSLSTIASKYDVATQAIADFNYILDTSSLAVGTELVIPGAKVPTPVFVAPTIPATSITPTNIAQVPTGSGWCRWPTSARIITQYFSWYHNGIDIATPTGSAMPPLYSCAGGTITRAGWDPFGLGLHVRINHGNGFETVYGHMSRIDVGYGERVSGGQVIGVMGSTGRSTGPHTHFIIKYNGVAQNPLNYIH